jgi:ankyrin repeat protein
MDMNFSCERCGGRKSLSVEFSKYEPYVLALVIASVCGVVGYFWYGPVRWSLLSIFIGIVGLLVLTRLRFRCRLCSLEQINDSEDPFVKYFKPWESPAAADGVDAADVSSSEEQKTEDEGGHKGYLLPIAAKILLSLFISFLLFALHFGKQAATTPGCWEGFVANPRIVLSEKWLCQHIAAANGDVELLGSLLDAGESVDISNGLGRTPLYEAAKRGHKDAARLLLKSGAAPNSRDPRLSLTPVHVAAEYNHPDTLELLLSAGGDANARAYSGTTPLRQASWKGHDDTGVYEVLLKYGADSSVGTAKGWTPLHHGAKLGHAQRVAYLVEHGAPVNTLTQRQRTPLYYAVRESKYEVARILLEAGADTEAGNPLWTPLRLAVDSKDDKMIRLLQEHGAIGGPEFFSLLREAAIIWNRGGYSEYLRITADAIEITDEFAAVYYWRAHALSVLLRFQEAHNELDRYIKLRPASREVQSLRLHLFMQETDHDAARELIDTMLVRWPDSGYAYMARGYLKLRIEHDMDGLDDLGRACDLDEEGACEMLAHARRHKAGDWIEQFSW